MKSKLPITRSPYGIKGYCRLLLFTGLGLTALCSTSMPALAGVKTNAVTAAASKVTGSVLDERGEALPGVTVTLKGTTTNTSTDVHGNFSLNFPDASAGTLVFSFVGYAPQEVAFNGNSKLTVHLQPDNKSLNEVVVVGYGTQKKATLTGSISVIKGADMVKSPEVDLSNSFAGRVSGVVANNTSGEPGYDGSSIVIRGLATYANTSVLVVVDGVPGQIGGLERLDPNDVESVSVLKDGSAAVYGSRAANGVILELERQPNRILPEKIHERSISYR